MNTEFTSHCVLIRYEVQDGLDRGDLFGLQLYGQNALPERPTWVDNSSTQ